MKLNVLLLIFFLSGLAFGQSPHQFKYQAVLRDANGTVISNQTKTILVEIIGGSITGQTVFTETHTVSTTELGLFTIAIGSTKTNGIAGVDWANGPFFLKVSVNQIVMGTTQLLSVPFAEYAEKAGNAFSGVYSDLTEKPELFSGSYVDLVDKPVLFSGSYSDLVDKPALFSGSYDELSGRPDLGVFVSLADDQQIQGVKTFQSTILATQGVDAGSHTISNLGDAINPKDAVSKAYVDQLKERVIDMERVMISNGSYRAIDVEDNMYAVAKIGNQVWMTQNLRVKKTSTGTPISDAFAYEGDQSNILYTWLSAQNACPSGWHLPSKDEFDELVTFLGGEATAGGKLKEAGTGNWHSPNTGATNSSGFNALPAGERFMIGTFVDLGNTTTFWTRTSSDSNFAWALGLNYNQESAGVFTTAKGGGFSVRCVKDID